MVYLAELLVVMTDRLKVVKVRARNVPRVHGHKRLDDDASLAPVSRAIRAAWGAVQLTQKSSPDNRPMSSRDL